MAQPTCHIKLTITMIKSKDPNKWRVFIFGRLNIVKMTILTDFLYRFNEIPTKIPESLLKDINLFSDSCEKE